MSSLIKKDVLWVPGAFELPLMAQKIASSKSYDGIVCLGAVIKGETQHFDYVCSEASSGIRQVSIKYDIPIGFGDWQSHKTASRNSENIMFGPFWVTSRGSNPNINSPQV